MSTATLPPPKVKGLTREKEAMLHRLIETVAERANLVPDEIYGPDNSFYPVQYRRAIWWAMREGYKMTLTNIARCFRGSKGATTMNHASIRSGLLFHVYIEEQCPFDESTGKWKQSFEVYNPTEQEMEMEVHRPELREALQIVAEEWNRINPENQLPTWRKSQ